MADRKRYTVLVPFPIGGGHYSRKGQVLELLDVQAHQLEIAGRIEAVPDLPAPVETDAAPVESAPAAAGKKKPAKAAE